FGPGIPAGTQVSSFTGTSITMTANATTTLNGIGLASRQVNNLHLYPLKITVLTPTTYSIQTIAGANIDTTTWGPWSTSGPSGVACQYISLQVGSGGSGSFPRVDYPCIFPDGTTPASFFGQYLGAN